MKSKILNSLIGLGAIVALVAYLSGCVTNPETGRRQLVGLVSEGKMSELGISSFDQLKKETPISHDANANAMVRRVGEKIRSVVNLPNAQWEFVVFESKEANAFCLPGGKIGVYTGILPIVKDDAGLATVLGHEVAHATLQHGRERMNEGLIAQKLGEGLGSIVDSKDPRWTSAFGQLYGFGANATVLLPHSRAQESEADHYGLIYMAKAGYDPAQAVAFWERFSAYNKQSGGSSPPAFLSTHPLNEQRIADLKKWQAEARAKAAGGSK